MLQELHVLPSALLETESRHLERLLGGPTLFHLDGGREPPLFVSVLLHGNETVGWEAVRHLLADYRERFGTLRLPRSLCLFVGNVAAAAAGVRHLPGQPDYNRVWPGCAAPPTPERAMMQRVVDIMRRRGVFASLDIHNNTGLNPHYACVNRLDNRYLHLAALFSRTLVYFVRPRGVQSIAMADLCPAVTLECGKVDDKHGVDHARDYLDACLHLSELPDHPVARGDIDLFHTVAQVMIPPGIHFGFPPADADFLLNPALERMNFRELARGTALGRAPSHNGIPLDVRDDSGRDVTGVYFEVEDGEVRLKLPVIPAMLTHNEAVIRQDCLCYLMEPYSDRIPLPDRIPLRPE